LIILEIELTCYEVKNIGEHGWQKIQEKAVMERLADSFDPVTPIISRMLRGEEIVVSQEIYRVINCKC
jgi:hypothetical protein